MQILALRDRMLVIIVIASIDRSIISIIGFTSHSKVHLQLFIDCHRESCAWSEEQCPHYCPSIQTPPAILTTQLD
jgi:hypothetical protein